MAHRATTTTKGGKEILAPEQVVRVSDMKGLGRIIAEKEIRRHGEYFCVIHYKNGHSIRTQVIPD